MTSGKKPKTLTQNIGDTDLSYLLYDGHDSTIILLHATGFLPWLWHPISRELSKSHSVIAPYFCDHRETDPEKGGLSWMTIAHDLAVFCKKLNIKKPLLVGHSMGATVLIMANAAFGLEASGLILIEPIFLPENLYNIKIRVEDHPLASKSIKRKNHWKDEEDAMSYLNSRSLFKNWDTEMLELYIRFGMKQGDSGGLQLTCSPKREASMFMGAMHYDPWPLLPKISCPTLVLEGEKSENRHYIDLKKISSLIPNSSYKPIAHAGHLIPMEKPKEIIAIINDFSSSI
jgi:pimeloyl-ACP methyl ester carboxylesterase